MEVRSGHDTSFWHDVWCPLGKLYDLLGERGFIDMGISNHSSVADAISMHRRRRHRVTILNQIEDELDVFRLRNRQAGADQPLWKRKNDMFKGRFSSQETWHLIRQASPICDWYKGVWFPFSTPKYCFIAWIAIHNRLATGDRLIQWNTEASGSCVFCDARVETRDHLFFSCSYSSHIWSALTRGLLGTRFTISWASILRLLTASGLSHLQTFILRYVFQLSIHSLWRERNGRRHGEPPLPAAKLTSSIDKSVRNRLSSVQRMGLPAYEGGLQLWFQIRST